MPTLLITTYPPYAHLLDETAPAIERHWPGHPPLVFGWSETHSLPARMLEDLRDVGAEFVVVMHEDLRLCAPVKQDLFDLCLRTMCADASLISCSLTWEPCSVWHFDFPKTSYAPQFQLLPAAWDYTINFQARIWRRKLLMEILERVPEGTTNSDLEPLATHIFRELLPRRRAITFRFPDPPVLSPVYYPTFVDGTDKSAWIVPYDNLIHAGERTHPCEYSSITATA